MPTSDVQRMHQDEWLSALRSGEYVQTFGDVWPNAQLGRNLPKPGDNRACAIGVGYIAGGVEIEVESNRPFEVHMGISDGFGECIAFMNDSGSSFAEIADWFKAERDAHAGDLSEWT